MDEDTAELAKALAGMRIRAIACHEAVSRAVTDVAYSQVNYLAGPDPTPQPKSTSSAGAGIPAEIEKRLWPRNAGRLPMPTGETANSPFEELAEPQSESPPYSPYRTRNPAAIPRRIDKPSLTRAWEYEKVRQPHYGQVPPPLNPVHMALCRLRPIISGEAPSVRVRAAVALPRNAARSVYWK